jgi:ankyrin repeat protein
MLCDKDINRSLFRAVSAGNVAKVREIINSFGLSYSPAWSEGYVLLRNAVKDKHTEVAKLLLANGSKVNTINGTSTDTALHFATINGDIQIVEMLVNRGAEINVKNRYGVTPLHSAVESKKMEIIELLVNEGADVNASNTNGITPMHLALENCSEEIINILLSRVADGKAKRKDCITYVRIAAERGYLQIVNHLLKHGVSINSEYRTPLCLAVIEGQEEDVQLLLEYGANVDAQDKDGKPVLHFAVERGHEKVVKLLLEHGAKVDAQDKGGKTVLHSAGERGHEKVVMLLLEHGATVDNQDKDGKTVLHSAGESGHEKVVILLLERGANVDAQDKDGRSVLHSAVERGHEKVVKLLLERGANVDAEDKDGKSVLHSAVVTGCSVIIEQVLRHCPDVNNKSNRSALNVAVRGYRQWYGKIVENLLQYGYTVNPEDVNNCELLHAAVEKGYLKIVEDLLKCGVDVNMLYKPTYGTGYMPLHVATRSHQEEVAKLLITYGADVNAQDETGKTPVFYATVNADLKITRLLLTNKANVKDDPELLSIAVRNERREIVEVLLQHGADVNTSDECGRTALHFTALDKSMGLFGYDLHKRPDGNVRGEIAKLLLIRGANVNAETKKGLTALHAATENGYVKVVEVLLEYNADVNSKSKDEYGITALHIASDRGHEQIVTALLEHGSDINVMSKDNLTPLDFAMAGMRFDDFYDDFYDRGRRIHGCGIIAKILKDHMVKMKTANLYVSKKNLWSIIDIEEISDFPNACEEEIARMKSEKVSNANVSYYDILTKGVSHLAMYARNESVVHILRQDDYKIKFPIYASMINSNFRQGERRKYLLEQGNKIFHFLFNNFPRLPHDCTERIFRYLSDEDLRIFIDACKPISIQQS